MTRRQSRDRMFALFMLLLLTIMAVTRLGPASAYSPQQGDSFSYSQTITVNNGQGSYNGYTDQSLITGSEHNNAVSGNNVSTNYIFSLQYSNSQGNTTSTSKAGNFTWSSSSHQYIQGTDNQIGYTPPIYVWFSIDPSTQVGGRAVLLNTVSTVVSKNASFQLTSEGRYVQAIQVQGTGAYQRNDSYGVFSASYTWDAYFDPSTGYIVGYHYVEQDNGEYQGQAGSFTYTDDLFVTATSYGLANASPPTSTSTGSILTQYGIDPDVILGVLLLVIVVIAISIYVSRRNKSPLQEHSPTPPSLATQPEWKSDVDMGSRPPQQVVIRDVAKVNCKYCGTLIPTTADTCPYCGGPRR